MQGPLLKENLYESPCDWRGRFHRLSYSEAVAWEDNIYHMARVVGIQMVLAELVKDLITNIASCERTLCAMQTGR
jgi:hypothetical protein